MNRVTWVAGLLAAGLGSAAPAPYSPQPTLEQLTQVRGALSRFEQLDAATTAGYAKFMDCMSNPQCAQGLHYTNAALLADPALDPLRPEALMYEPRADGSLRLVGLEYLVFQKAWHDAGHRAAPALLGREFSLNTTLLPQPFYALHLWVWQYNPLDLFANWNPLVSCPGVGAWKAPLICMTFEASAPGLSSQGRGAHERPRPPAQSPRLFRKELVKPQVPDCP